jgi:type-F conjugative transfer system secretin TraK
LFLVTESGRHFSLLVSPDAKPGVTYDFIPMGKSNQAAHWEEQGEYTTQLVSVLRDMMRGDVPDGYGYHAVAHAKPWLFKRAASLTLISEYQGEHWRGEVFEVHNNTKKSLLLTPNGFYGPGVKAVALSKQTLVPGETGYVYDIKSTEAAE